ncbi:MAG TPA: cyclophane-containing peptide 2OG-Fe(II) oxygenase YhhC [Steroidobacteraceae bacterium]|nr:cyclophane-containing peptide 2OG-Fe(II) oxygenase YhhC [Steroidobacteraceae bacterium]
MNVDVASETDTRPPVSIAGAVVSTEPFPHAALAGCIDTAEALRLLAWFDSGAPWHLVETDFYEQFEFCLWDTAAEAGNLISPATLRNLRAEMASAFGVQFEERVNVVAHKLTPGQRIAIHNDYLVGEETHRLIVQLNRGLHDDDGGLLLTFNSDNARDVREIFRPVHRSGFAFAISPRSFHAISKMHRSVRYTLIFSFYCVDGCRAK